MLSAFGVEHVSKAIIGGGVPKVLPKGVLKPIKPKPKPERKALP